jgi:hypothetical protein
MMMKRQSKKRNDETGTTQRENTKIKRGGI